MPDLNVSLAEEDDLRLDLVDDEILNLEPALLLLAVRSSVNVDAPYRILVSSASERLVRDVRDEIVLSGDIGRAAIEVYVRQPIGLLHLRTVAHLDGLKREVDDRRILLLDELIGAESLVV